MYKAPTAIIASLNTYAEISPSGSGVHIWLKEKISAGSRCRTRVHHAEGLGGKPAQIEVYSHGRFLTITGDHLAETSTNVENRQEALSALHHRIFGERSTSERTARTAVPLDFTMEPSEMDRLLVERILFEHPTILKTWAANESEADFAFCCEAARIVGPHPRVIDCIFRASPLYARPDRKQK